MVNAIPCDTYLFIIEGVLVCGLIDRGCGSSKPAYVIICIPSKFMKSGSIQRFMIGTCVPIDIIEEVMNIYLRNQV